LLSRRLIQAAAIVFPLIGLCWIDFHYNAGRPAVWLFPLAIVASVLACGELLALLRAAGLNPTSWVVYSGTTLTVLAAGAPILWKEYPADCPVGKLGWVAGALSVGLVLAIVDQILRYQGSSDEAAVDNAAVSKPIVNLAAAMFSISYIGLGIGLMTQLRILGGNTPGMVAMISLIAVTKLSDAGAYGCGRTWGRHKMAPKVSPGKTIEGAIGGFAFALLGAYLVLEVIAPMLFEPSPMVDGSKIAPWWGWIVYGPLVCLAGMIGDLGESLLKREARIKDSSSWLVGLGGILDLLDSLLISAPVAYACWVVGLVGF